MARYLRGVFLAWLPSSSTGLRFHDWDTGLDYAAVIIPRKDREMASKYTSVVADFCLGFMVSFLKASSDSTQFKFINTHQGSPNVQIDPSTVFSSNPIPSCLCEIPRLITHIKYCASLNFIFETTFVYLNAAHWCESHRRGRTHIEGARLSAYHRIIRGRYTCSHNTTVLRRNETVVFLLLSTHLPSVPAWGFCFL